MNSPLPRIRALILAAGLVAAGVVTAGTIEAPSPEDRFVQAGCAINWNTPAMTHNPIQNDPCR